MAKKSDVLVARVSAVLKFNGKRVVLNRGQTTAHANHPIVRGHEHLFTNLVVDYAVDEESDTRRRLREEAEAESAEDEKEQPKRVGRPPKKVAPVKTAEAKKEDE